MSIERIQAGRQSSAVVPQLISRAKPKLAAVATRYLSEERLCALALSMWNKDRRLQQCSAESFLLAIYKACQLGLDPTGIGNQGHIVAYKGQAQFIRGWGGVITQAARQGITIDTFAVYEGDEFEVARYVNSDGYHLGLHHVEKRDDPEGIGEVRAAYAVASCKDWDQPMIEVVWRHDIDKIRSNSASPNSPAWKAWYSEMARKTAVNRLAKRLPLFVEIKVTSNEDRNFTVSKEKVAISAIPNEDTYYEGRVGNKEIDAPIDGGPESKPEPEQSSTKVELIAEAIALREDFPSLYGQVLGRKDITKLTDEDLKAALSKVRELGSEAESHSASEMVEHEESLGF